MGNQEKRQKKNPNPQNKKSSESTSNHKVLRWVLVFAALAFVLIMLAARVTGINILYAPEHLLQRVVTPVQSAFASVTDAVSSFFYDIKLHFNIEKEYNRIKAENEELVYQALRADYLQDELNSYEDLLGEISSNSDMNPIVCSVIGRDSNNYFSVFTIDKGSNDGIEDFMAVTTSGAMVGVTYDVTATTAKVRTIIDSEASIPCLIESSRDQGTVRGTYGMDGDFMCRMYYLSYSTIPRPGDTVITSGVSLTIPKGIPVGTVVESTRSMDQNKQYIVVEPKADFQHIEYVIVYRYRPVAESVSARSNTSYSSDFATVAPERPIPTIHIGDDVIYLEATPSPVPDDEPMPTPGIDETPAPEGAAPTPTPAPEVTEQFSYHVPGTDDTTPVPVFSIITPVPSPSPTPTFDPSVLTLEED